MDTTHVKTHTHAQLHVQVSDQPLTSFAAHENGSTMAVGTADGATTILQLSAGLSEMALNEKSAMNNMVRGGWKCAVGFGT